MDDVHPDSNGRRLRHVCISDQRDALRSHGPARDLLRDPVLGDAPDSVGALRAKALRAPLELDVLGKPTRGIPLLKHPRGSNLRRRGRKAARPQLQLCLRGPTLLPRHVLRPRLRLRRRDRLERRLDQ